MKRYILATAQGATPQGDPIRPGRFPHTADKAGDAVARLLAASADSPALAALRHPGSVAGMKLYSLQTWRTGDQAYTVIKEEPLPTVTLGQKLAFALLVAREIFDSEALRAWVTDWLAGRGRSRDAIQVVRKALDKERSDVAAFREMVKISAAAGGERQAEEQEALLARVTRVVNAAEAMLAPEPDAAAVEAEIATALEGLDIPEGRLDWTALARQALQSG